MEKILQLLHRGDYSCVIANKGEVRTYTQRGVADLYDLVKNDPAFLEEALVADKVIGKAAAALLIMGEVKEVYTDLISESALKLFSKTKIEVDYMSKVPHIQNRDQNDWCPLERITFEEESIDRIFLLIEDFVLKMRANRK